MPRRPDPGQAQVSQPIMSGKGGDRGQWKKRPQEGAGGGGAGNKKRKYFAAGYGNAGIPQGSRGILISCIGGKEQQASHEAARLLQEVRAGLLPCFRRSGSRATSNSVVSGALPHP